MRRRAAAQRSSQPLPWYRRAYLWGQTNITEKDPVRYDIAWWRAQWKRTQVQAVIVNAGGIVAYYPSKYPLHHRAEFLNGRDLFGELTTAAHDDGIFVMARMDSNRTSQDFFDAHPDWFTRDAGGRPYRAADKYITCINSPYYDEYLPDILREIIERSHPDGFTDNSWSGMGRESICYCDNCARLFRRGHGKALPRNADWDDPAYREWIGWNYERRIEVWELNNRVTRAAGGPDCIWSGMNSGSVTAQARSFRDLREICRRADIVMLDHQRRDDDTGFQQNGDTGKRVHGMLGWDKLAPESMAMYQSGPGYYRVASKPAAEARMWMIAGIAGGIQPWWHYVGAYHEDRRMYRTPEPVMRWWNANEGYLVDRTPVASVGLVWSQRNTDFFGRDDPGQRVDAPYTGFMHALVRARIPYLPVHVDDIDSMPAALTVLILPNVGALSDAQAASIRRFVERGGSLVATGQTSLYDEWGDPRADFALADLFGCHLAGDTRASLASREPRAAGQGGGAFAPSPSGHTYLRLTPELRAGVDGPRAGDEPAIAGNRHPVLRGFDETDILAFGGTLSALKVEAGVDRAVDLHPAVSDLSARDLLDARAEDRRPGPAAVAARRRPRRLHAGGRRSALRRGAPARSRDARSPTSCAGPPAIESRSPSTASVSIDCHLYEQPGRLILHLVNLTSEATWRAPVDELIKVGPFTVKVRLPASMRQATARLLVSGLSRPVTIQGGMAVLTVESILDHEVVVIAGGL